MPRVLLLICAVVWLCNGCGKNSPPQSTLSGATNSAAAVTPEADLTGVLAELTQALRKFSVEKQKVPASLDELVAAGYLNGLPPAPAGKSFAIDSKNVQVILK